MKEPTRENFKERLTELAEEFLTDERLQRIEDVLSSRIANLTVIFESFYDPLNISACLRSCEIFACQNVHVVLSEDYKPNRGTARNASRWLTIHNYDDSATCFAELKSQGFTIVGTLVEPGSHDFKTMELPDKLCIVMGAEHDGISDFAREHCDAFMHIPNSGFTQSLNVSNAMAILMEYFSSTYRATARAEELSYDTKKSLRDAWYERDLRAKFKFN